MRRSLLAVMLALSAGSAHASGTISCTGEDGVTVELTIGNLPVLSIVGATITAAGTTWTTIPDAEGEAIAVGQAFRDGERVLVDLTDPNVERVMIELRLQIAAEERSSATAGTLRMVGQGVYAVTCVGP